MLQPNPFVQGLMPYVPGAQSGGEGTIKLNTNEFPYPAAPEVIEAIRSAATDAIRLYPSSRCDALRSALAELHGVVPENILVGNGSDEILRLVIQAYASPGRMTATLWPTYSLYPALVAMTGAALHSFALDDLERLPAEIFEARWDLLLVPCPNAPLGSVFDPGELARLARSGGMLVVDEAYADFADDPGAVQLLDEHRNIIVTRTFSKAYGLAGLRVGYAIAEAGVIAELAKLADSYNVNRISQAAALAAIAARGYYADKIETIKTDRAWLGKELTRRGFDIPASQGNYVFARRRTPGTRGRQTEAGAASGVDVTAEAIYLGLKACGILVRWFDHPDLRDGVRITIGTRDQLERLLGAIDELTQRNRRPK